MPACVRISKRASTHAKHKAWGPAYALPGSSQPVTPALQSLACHVTPWPCKCLSCIASHATAEASAATRHSPPSRVPQACIWTSTSRRAGGAGPHGRGHGLLTWGDEDGGDSRVAQRAAAGRTDLGVQHNDGCGAQAGQGRAGLAVCTPRLAPLLGSGQGSICREELLGGSAGKLGVQKGLGTAGPARRQPHAAGTNYIPAWLGWQRRQGCLTLHPPQPPNPARCSSSSGPAQAIPGPPSLCVPGSSSQAVLLT
jgi:hypothetical protein